MNLREGTRRLALLLGAGGFLFGGFVSYFELNDLLNQHRLHNQFSALADSVEVKKLSKEHIESKDPWESYVTSIQPKCCGIKTITWDKDHIFNNVNGIYSIEISSGQTLYPTPAPSIWMYVLVVLFPFIGFLVPWSIIRAIGWVCAGFFQPAR